MAKKTLKSFDVIALNSGIAIWCVEGVDAQEAWKEVEANAKWLCEEAGCNDISGLNLEEPK